MIKLQRANYPEEVGVSTRKLIDFMQDVIDTGINYHSIMVIRHNKVAFESFRPPYTPDRPHAMYSASKSVTSAAIGFAINEGLLSLDTRIIDIFPEHKPVKKDSRLEKLTVRHLITMTSGKEPSLMSDKTKADWVEEFIKSPAKYEPGEKFRYTNENIYLLSAIINKVTNQSMVEYLVPRLFNPLNIETPLWETDRNGIESGGWGLYFKSEDLAKFTLTYLNEGNFFGKQVIPRDWAIQSVQKHTDNSFNRGYDTNRGYGYCFWMNSCENTYRVDGMFSQFGIVLPDYDAAIITTGGQLDETGVFRKCMWRHFPGVFDDNAEYIEQDLLNLKQLSDIPLPVLPASTHPDTEKRINGRIIKTSGNRLLNKINMPHSILSPVVVFMSRDHAGGVDNIKLVFEGDYLILDWDEGDESNSIKCSMKGDLAYDKIRLASQDFTTASCACWRDENTLEILIRPLEAVASRNIIFKFTGNKVKIIFTGCPSMKEIAEDLAIGAFPDLITNSVMLRLARFMLMKFHKILEPPVYGILL
jgi:CubicO group peptidase (beta-lactamase class C family)